jgi:WD40 repeat protein
MSNFPYPGLRPFKQEETDIFFGREEHIHQLLKKLENATHFLAVIGTSGCGKSSLVHTGLLAKLEQGYLTKAGTIWRLAELHPTHRPFENLAKTLLAESALGQAYISQFSDYTDAIFALQTSLRKNPNSIGEILQNTFRQENPNFLLLIDQFEELFRLYQQGQEHEATAFVALLLESSKLANVYVVITMRSDFLGECTLFDDLPEIINQGLFLTPRLHREQLRAAIETPARVFGGQLEPALVNQLLDEASNDADQLPLLQHALMRMWHLACEDNPQQIILTLKHYQSIGGRLATALSQHADETYKALGPAQFKIAAMLFRSLTELGNDHRDSRRPVELRNVAAQAGVPWERVAAIVEMFRQSGRSFLTPGEGTDLEPTTIINITHESLIREWQRLKNWAKNEAVSAALYQRLEIDARLWEEGETEVWHGLNLNNALVWRNLERPNKIWASRYSKHFDLAMRFLDASETRQNQEQQQVEAARTHELQRHRARTQAIGAVIALVVVALLALFEFFQVRYALHAQQRAEASEQARSLNLFESQLTHAALRARVEDYSSAKQILHNSHELDAKVSPSRQHTRNLLAWYTNLRGDTSSQIYEGAEVQLTAIALSPDAKLLAASGEDGVLVLFEVQTGKLLKRLKGHSDYVKALVFHPQGNWLASAGSDKQIILWNPTTGEQLRQWQVPEKIYALAVTPDGKYLASGGPDNLISLWEVTTGKKIQIFTGHEESIAEGGLSFSPNGKLLASGSYDDKARLWEVKSGKTLHILTGHTNDVEGVTFSPDGKSLATSSDDNSVRIWDVNTGEVLNMLTGHQNRVYGICFVQGGHYLVSASYDSTLRLWDLDSGITLRVLQGHVGRVIGIATDDKQVWSASGDGTVRRWEIKLPSQTFLDFDNLEPHTAAIAPDGHSVAVGFANGDLHLYSLPDTHLLWEKKAHDESIERVTFSADSQFLATASADNKAKLWQAQQGELQQTFTGHHAKLTAVAFSPNSKELATASEDGQVGLFTIGSSQARFIPAHEGKKVLSVAYDNTGTHLLSSGRDKRSVRLWNLAEDPPEPLQSYSHTPAIRWATLSPDNQRLAAVGLNQLIHLYKVGEQTPQQITGHEQTIFRAIFSPDSQQLVTAGGDATIRFWDLANNSELFTLRFPTQTKDKEGPLLDFDFRCTPQDCWIAVPLTGGKLVLYDLGRIYEKEFISANK